jgi:hypothetical protein
MIDEKKHDNLEMEKIGLEEFINNLHNSVKVDKQ